MRCSFGGRNIPSCPAFQYTGEKSADPTTLFVYAGADGTLPRYEDDGASYGCERGKSGRIPLRRGE